MRSLLMSLGLLVLLASQSVNSAPLTFADYAQLPEKSMMRVSPSGTKLAYRMASEDRDLLIVMDLTTGEMIRAADIAAVNPDHVYFIDEDRVVLMASNNTRMFGYHGRHDVSAAFSFNLETGDLHQLLTAGKGIHSGQTSVGSVVGISPDGRYAYMPAWDDKNNYSLFKADLSKRRSPKRHKKGTNDTIDFFVDDNGEMLARERFNNRANLHRLEAWIDDEWVEIFREETDIRHVGFTGITPDQKSIVMIRQDGAHGRWAYYTLSLADGSESGPYFSKEDRDIEHVLTDINRVVYGVQYSGFKPSYEFFDKKLNARMRGIQAALPGYALAINDYSPDWANIVIHMSGEDNSGQYLRYRGGKLDSLGMARPKITHEHVNLVKVDAYDARDGLNIPTLLTMPKGVEAKKLPTIMLPHGGPESYDKIGFHWLAQYFSSQGYLVIQPQFRGSEGFGPEHLFKGRGEWGRKMNDDLTDAVTEFAKRGLVDPERVCIVGSSYGGYAALAAVAFTPDVYKCAVSINGLADIERMMKQEKRDYGRHHWVVSYWDRVISNKSLDEDHLEKISPINFVKDIKAPVLLVHGEHDLVVPYYQSDNMFDEMEDEDKQVTFIELDEGDHDMSNPKNRAIALEAIDKFVKQHL
ncbi:S9 family peptidase [Thalassotalea litorea]|uniref:S9 family peptidase n=1 Tax=Thalassotalea litorea TaxID=2020715 RepID=A0A5R9IVK0_9GAMM|nr:alpha/beta fold hydrolase [Thalassotalea litorea]TLU67391.1 S9 family peptidase [Thalassotalea litorea]